MHTMAHNNNNKDSGDTNVSHIEKRNSLTISSFLEYELLNNRLLIELRNHGKVHRAALDYLKMEGGLILLPQDVALEGLAINSDFIAAHIVKQDVDKLHFIAFNGAQGIFQGPASEVLSIKNGGELNRTMVRMFSYSDGNILDSEENNIDFSTNSDFTRKVDDVEGQVIFGLRRGKIQLDDCDVPFVVISQPIISLTGPPTRLQLPSASSGNNNTSDLAVIRPKLPAPLPDEMNSPRKSSSIGSNVYDGDQFILDGTYADVSTSSISHSPRVVRSVHDTSDSPNANPDASDNVARAPGPSFSAFLNSMRHPASYELVRSIKQFISEFLSPRKSGLNIESIVSSVHGFLRHTEKEMCDHPVWRNASPEIIHNAIEGLEKYVMHKISCVTFCPLYSDDADADAHFTKRVNTLNFITADHLEIGGNWSASEDEMGWQLGGSELLKINAYKAPRDKMTCILNCCKIIFNTLQRKNDAGVYVQSSAGADEFLPRLIFIVLRTNPPYLISNFRYIQRFRHPDKLCSEVAYYLTNLDCAISFINNLNETHLKIDHFEFRARLANTYVEKDVNSFDSTTTNDCNLNVEAIDNEPNEQSSSALNDILGISIDPPLSRFTEIGVEADDLTLRDVRILLSDYRRLANVHAQLVSTLSLNFSEFTVK